MLQFLSVALINQPLPTHNTLTPNTLTPNSNPNLNPCLYVTYLMQACRMKYLFA